MAKVKVSLFITERQFEYFMDESMRTEETFASRIRLALQAAMPADASKLPAKLPKPIGIIPSARGYAPAPPN